MHLLVSSFHPSALNYGLVLACIEMEGTKQNRYAFNLSPHKKPAEKDSSSSHQFAPTDANKVFGREVEVEVPSQFKFKWLLTLHIFELELEGEREALSSGCGFISSSSPSPTQCTAQCTVYVEEDNAFTS